MASRFYTFTIKATKTEFKGNYALLQLTFQKYLNELEATNVTFSQVEDNYTPNVHLHAMIECPYIQNKAQVAKKFYGWSSVQSIVRKEDEPMVKYIWFNYINKCNTKISDSTRIHECFGNMFI